MNNAISKFTLLNHSFICDGLSHYPHYAPISKLTFISRSSSGISQIGCLDEQGMVSVWNVIEISTAMTMNEELNLSLGAKFKMVLSYSDNLMLYPNVVDPFTMNEVTSSI